MTYQDRKSTRRREDAEVKMARLEQHEIEQ